MNEEYNREEHHMEPEGEQPAEMGVGDEAHMTVQGTPEASNKTIIIVVVAVVVVVLALMYMWGSSIGNRQEELVPATPVTTEEQTTEVGVSNEVEAIEADLETTETELESLDTELDQIETELDGMLEQ